ncbi:sporulation protein YhbH [archaeon]|nr:sporulation protein YhbH [archaeon]
MSTFKEHKTSADRSASDRRRHKQKIEKAIRDGVYHIVAEESIIGEEGKKKIRIPVRGIKEYRFVYGDNETNSRVGSAPGKNITRGQTVGQSQQSQSPGDQVGNEKGIEYYEVEITLDELADYLFRDLELPELERKKLKVIRSERFKRHGYRKQGIRPRLDKKKTAVNRIKRKAATQRHDDILPDERFSFHEDDLEYRHIKKSFKESSNAVIFFIMDISGSMTQDKKFLARSFYFLIYQFLRYRYENIEMVFISHDVAAYEVNEKQFFTRGTGGGTLVSSAIRKTLDIIAERFHPELWNIYCFQCSDGDNWPEDEAACNEAAMVLKQHCQLYTYCEIEPQREKKAWISSGGSNLHKNFVSLIDKNFKIVEIFQKEDVWPAFRKIFGGKLNE